jgi:uncharacterized protein
MLSSDEILKIINEKQQDNKKFGIKSIGLFGSYSINKQKKESDIDLLVEFKKGKKTFDNYMDLKFYLENLFDCKVDLVIKEALKVDLKPNIAKNITYSI